MRYPNLQIENNLWRQGYCHIAGVDEAGRGALAGPIVAAAVILNPKKKISGLRDSKLLTAPARERLFEIIIRRCLAYSIMEISHKQIDETGIGKINLLVLKRAIEQLELKPDYLLIDAFKLECKDIQSRSIIKGDVKVTSIAAASIIAKVTRDEIMRQYHNTFPDYGFAEHKGYGTNKHLKMLKRHGPSKIHRRSYEPIKNLLNG